MKYPKIYYQTVKLREIWARSKSLESPMMIEIFDEYLELIREQCPQFIADEIEEIDDLAG